MFRPKKRLFLVIVDIEKNEVSKKDHDTQEDSLLYESEFLLGDENLVSLGIESFSENNEVRVK